MFDFIAEAAVLLGILGYARARRTETETPEQQASKTTEKTSPKKQHQHQEKQHQDKQHQEKQNQEKNKPEPDTEELQAKPSIKLPDFAKNTWSALSNWTEAMAQSISFSKDSKDPPSASKNKTQPKAPAISKKQPNPASWDAAQKKTNTPQNETFQSSPGRSLWSSPPPSAENQAAETPPTPKKPEPAPEKFATPTIAAPHTETSPAPEAAVSPEPSPNAPPTAQPPKPGNMISDPVCGKEVPWTRAVSLRVGHEVIYFCSKQCKEQYSKEAKP